MNGDTSKKIQIRRGYRVSIGQKGFQAFVNPEQLFCSLSGCDAFSDDDDAIRLKVRIQRALDFLKLFPGAEQAINISSIASCVAEHSFGLAMHSEDFESQDGPSFVLELPAETAKVILLSHLRLDRPRQGPLELPDMAVVAMRVNSGRGFDSPTVADVLYALEIAKPLNGPLYKPVADALTEYCGFLSYTIDGKMRRKEKADLPGNGWQAQGTYPYIEAMQAIMPVWASDTEAYKKWAAAMKALGEPYLL